MRRTGNVWTTVVCLSIALALAACGATSGDADKEVGPPVRGGDLTVIRATDIDGWDPEKAFEIASFQALQSVMEGLVRPNPEGLGVVPGLASSWKTDKAGTTLTFHLRDEAAFSDGSPVTADDVVFSVEMWLQGVSYGQLYADIAGASAVDEHTVQIKLKKASSVTLAWLASGTSVIVPKDFGGKEREAFFDEPVGAGPFMVEEHKPGQTLKLVRNPHYYNPELPYLDSITYATISDPNQELLQYHSGDADVIETVPADVANQIPEGERSVVSPAVTVQSAWVNLERAPTDNVHFRRAVSYAIDREAYVEAAMGGYGTAAEAGLPQGVEGSATCGCDSYRQDLELAKQELAESGYDGEPVVLLAPSETPVQKRGAQIVADMLEDIGVNVDLQLPEMQVMYDMFDKGEYHLEIAEIGSVSPTVGDIFSLIPYIIPGLDDASVKVINDGYAALDAATDETEREAATQEIEKWWAEQLPYVPIANPDHVAAIKPQVQGWEMTPYLMYPADRVWLSDQ